MLNQRENTLRTLHHQRPEYLGVDMNMIFPREIKDNVARGFVNDGLPFDPVREAGGQDMFGVTWVYEPAARGSMVMPGNPVLEEIEEWKEKIPVPNLDEIDWESVGQRCRKLIDPNRLTGTMVFSGYFERLISVLDFENAAMTMIDEDAEADVRSFFEMLTRYYCDLFPRLRKYCGIDLITFHDDWGHQLSSFFSVDTCRELILPYLKRIVAACHENGMLFELHCCGKVERLVPLMVEAGIDKWDGQQINDLWGLQKAWGDKLCITFTEKKNGISQQEAESWVRQLLEQMDPKADSFFAIPTRGLGPVVSEELYKQSAAFLAGG